MISPLVVEHFILQLPHYEWMQRLADGGAESETCRQSTPFDSRGMNGYSNKVEIVWMVFGKFRQQKEASRMEASNHNRRIATYKPYSQKRNHCLREEPLPK